jgi:hypothetical protein
MKDEGENVVAVTAVMAILVVLLAIGTVERGEFMAGVSGIVMVLLVMNMRAHRIHPYVTMQPGRRRPSELERDDEHDDQGDETAHWTHSTEPIVSTKGYFMFGCPSISISKVALICRSTRSPVPSSHCSAPQTESTVHYQGVEVDDALEIAEQTDTSLAAIRCGMDGR